MLQVTARANYATTSICIRITVHTLLKYLHVLMPMCMLLIVDTEVSGI
jgi:hypothetical protein